MCRSIITDIVVALTLAGFMAAHASAQSLNIDYGAGSGTPSNEYAGAGLPGMWNSLTGEHQVPESLVGLDGTPLAAVVMLIEGAGGAVYSVDDPGTSGDDEHLLDDFAHGGTDVVGAIVFGGLENGIYEVITYAWTPGSPDVFTSLWPDCDLPDDPHFIGGPWPGQLEEGVTHLRHTATVTDGTLMICTAGTLYSEGAINGVQLVGLDCDNGEPDICLIPPDTGPCDGLCPRLFYNACAQQCEWFTYGCCEGNSNNFLTLEECEAACLGGEAIPTVSEWGMVALTLLVLTAGMLVFVRRRTAHA